MRRELKPSVQANLLGTYMMSMSLLANTAAIGYFTNAIDHTQRDVPAILAQIVETTNAVRPKPTQIAPIRDDPTDLL